MVKITEKERAQIMRRFTNVYVASKQSREVFSPGFLIFLSDIILRFAFLHALFYVEYSYLWLR